MRMGGFLFSVLINGNTIRPWALLLGAALRNCLLRTDFVDRVLCCL